MKVSHLKTPLHPFEFATLWVVDDVVFCEWSVTAGTGDEWGIILQTRFEDQVGCDAAGVKGHAYVERPREVVQVALEEGAVGQAWKNREKYKVIVLYNHFIVESIQALEL